MIKRKLRRFRKDQKGMALVEFAMVITMTLVFVGVIVDFFRMFYEWNAATKAVERGARIAAVSNPVAMGLKNLNAIGACTPGDTYRSTTSYDPQLMITCDGATASCDNGLGFDATAMSDIVYGRGNTSCASAAGPYNVGMCHMHARIKPANVLIKYTAAHLGFCGRPGGPVVTVTLSLKGLKYDFLFLGGLIPSLADGSSFFPKATTSVTSEDLSSCDPGANTCP